MLRIRDAWRDSENGNEPPNAASAPVSVNQNFVRLL